MDRFSRSEDEKRARRDRNEATYNPPPDVLAPGELDRQVTQSLDTLQFGLNQITTGRFSKVGAVEAHDASPKVIEEVLVQLFERFAIDDGSKPFAEWETGKDAHGFRRDWELYPAGNDPEIAVAVGRARPPLFERLRRRPGWRALVGPSWPVEPQRVRVVWVEGGVRDRAKISRPAPELRNWIRVDNPIEQPIGGPPGTGRNLMAELIAEVGTAADDPGLREAEERALGRPGEESLMDRIDRERERELHERRLQMADPNGLYQSGLRARRAEAAEVDRIENEAKRTFLEVERTARDLLVYADIANDAVREVAVARLGDDPRFDAYYEQMGPVIADLGGPTATRKYFEGVRNDYVKEMKKLGIEPSPESLSVTVFVRTVMAQRWAMENVDFVPVEHRGAQGDPFTGTKTKQKREEAIDAEIGRQFEAGLLHDLVSPITTSPELILANLDLNRRQAGITAMDEATVTERQTDGQLNQYGLVRVGNKVRTTEPVGADQA